MLGDNVTHYKVKPFYDLAVGEIPRAFKPINKHMLPVYDKNNKSWMIQLLF